MALRVSVDDFKRMFGLELPAAPKPARKAIRQRAPTIGQLLQPIDTRRMKLTEEQALSAGLYNRLVQLHMAGQLRCTFTAIPLELPIPTFTEQLRNMAVMIGMKRRAMGCLPGAADWVFVWASGGGWIELKIPGGNQVWRKVKRVGGEKLHPTKTPAGRLNDEQVAFQGWCNSAGANHAICHSVSEAEAVLQGWGAVADPAHVPV